MSDTFRFSRRPNRAHEIQWRPWTSDVFAQASVADRPILLSISVIWCQQSNEMDETTFSAPAVISLVNERFTAIRVDGDIQPDVQDRYIAGGWPTTAFLTPTGEVIWAGTFVAEDALISVAQGVLQAWNDKRDDFRAEIARRQMVVDAARGRRPSAGLVRREAADDVLTAVRDQFDLRNGGFGDAPKFPMPGAIELLFRTESLDPEHGLMAERTLDGMIAGDLRDERGGGFFRYALGADWTAPRYEKLLEVNAGMLRACALGAHMRERGDWKECAESTVEWADRELARPNGLWASSLWADDAWYESDGPTGDRPAPDPMLFTTPNATWISALADAGGRFGRCAWVRAASDGIDELFNTMISPSGLPWHHRSGDAGEVASHLFDTVELGGACLSVAQGTGSPRHIERARNLARCLETHFWTDDGGFCEWAKDAGDNGPIHHLDRPFEVNAAAARFLLDLSMATGERAYRALAERVLAVLSPLAGRQGPTGAGFAIAVEEYFDAPLRVYIVGEGDDAGALRQAALQLREPGRQVWPAENGATIGAAKFSTSKPAAAFVCRRRGGVARVTDPAALEQAIDA